MLVRCMLFPDAVSVPVALALPVPSVVAPPGPAALALASPGDPFVAVPSAVVVSLPQLADARLLAPPLLFALVLLALACGAPLLLASASAQQLVQPLLLSASRRPAQLRQAAVATLLVSRTTPIAARCVVPRPNQVDWGRQTV